MMASTSMRKFHLMQYKSSEKLYEKVCSVEAMHMPLLDSVPEKITYKFDSESSMDPGASLLRFELLATNDGAKRKLPKLGAFLARGKIGDPGAGSRRAASLPLRPLTRSS